MRVYLASRFERREEVEEVADQLRDLGVEVTSRWHMPQLHDWDDAKGDMPYSVQQRFAEEDCDDLAEADAFICFTDGTPSRGGKHVEFGMAWGLGLDLVIVGPRENIFHSLNDVTHLKSAGGLLEYVRAELAEELI